MLPAIGRHYFTEMSYSSINRSCKTLHAPGRPPAGDPGATLSVPPSSPPLPPPPVAAAGGSRRAKPGRCRRRGPLLSPACAPPRRGWWARGGARWRPILGGGAGWRHSGGGGSSQVAGGVVAAPAWQGGSAQRWQPTPDGLDWALQAHLGLGRSACSQRRHPLEWSWWCGSEQEG
jgi:hypothetical protein